MAFKVGDVVVLKSGGADMTVSSIGMGGLVCVWQSPTTRGGNTPHQRTYPAEALRAADPPLMAGLPVMVGASKDTDA